MKVEDVMTREVRTVGPDTRLKDVAEILADLRVSGVPVVEREQVVGVVSEADILMKERAEGPVRHGLLGLLHADRGEVEAKLQAVTASEAMTAPAVTIGPTNSVSEAAATMIDKQVNRLPVVDGEGVLVGIVTRADLVRAFVRSDEEIEREIREEVIFRTLWIPPERVVVSVDKGQVTLTGRIETKSDADLLPKFVQRVAGVVSVDSQVTWMTDDSGRRGPPPA
jgi:CBS domain-containing protein